MKKDRYTFRLVSMLLVASFILYVINYLLFRDLHHIVMFFTEDLAFIPIEVLVTVLIIEKELERREKIHKLQKINLAIEIFFEEVGNELLEKIASKDKESGRLSRLLPKLGESMDNKAKEIEKAMENYNCTLHIDKADILEVYGLLKDNKESFLRFIENPYLSEHDIFTDLLQSAIHLHSEIKIRSRNGELSKEDINHLRIDILRLYKYLSKEWVVYMKYIEKEYPFLYTFALEHMPFA
ncbi:hypothetical protein [Clostridium sp. LP20]|uniref:hypothetical protein n=1 Tax=Clostridium sp. LP20 TaxID=3418665 RepID=UPI003EE58371